MGGLGGPSACFLMPAALLATSPVNGMSGWLCMTLRSEARSRYLGCSVFTPIAATFSRATSLRFASLKFFCKARILGQGGSALADVVLTLCRSDSVLCRFSWSSDLNCRAHSRQVIFVVSENSNSTSTGTGVAALGAGLGMDTSEETDAGKL